MTTELEVRAERVAGTDEERRAWEDLLARHGEEVRAELYRALFDDVRPAWEEHFARMAEKQPAST